MQPPPKPPPYKSSLPCTVDSLGAPADGQEVRPVDMTGKHGERIPLERSQLLGREGKVVLKCECPALKPPSAGTGLEGTGEPHVEMQQTDQVELSLFKQVSG